MIDSYLIVASYWLIRPTITVVWMSYLYVCVSVCTDSGAVATGLVQCEG